MVEDAAGPREGAVIWGVAPPLEEVKVVVGRWVAPPLEVLKIEVMKRMMDGVGWVVVS